MPLDETPYPSKQNIGDAVRNSAKDYLTRVDKGERGEIAVGKKKPVKEKKLKKPDNKKAFEHLKKNGGKE